MMMTMVMMVMVMMLIIVMIVMMMIVMMIGANGHNDAHIVSPVESNV
jgi:hypothetical protein